MHKVDFLKAGEEKHRCLVHTGLARRRWVFTRSMRGVGGALALDVGILTGLFVDTMALICHRCVRNIPSQW